MHIKTLASAWLVLFLGMASSAAPGLDRQTEKEEAERLFIKAENLWYLSAFTPALENLGAALKLSDRLADPRLTALCLNLMGTVSDSQGDYALGWERHQRALQLTRELDDRRLEASVLADIGLGYWRQANYAQALDYCQRALAIQEQTGDHVGLAKTLVYIGRVYLKQGAYEKALESYRSALTTQEAGGDHRGQSITLEDMGDIHQEQGSYTQALEYYHHALRIREEMEDRAGQCYLLHIVGRCYMIQGANREALSWFRRALHLSRVTEDLPGRASALYHMGTAYSRQGAYARAAEYYQQALKIFGDLGNRRQQAWVLAYTGDMHYHQGDFARALTCYQHATKIWEETRDRRGLNTGLVKLGRVYYHLGDDQRALEYFRRDAKLQEEAQMPYLPITLGSIGRIHARQGDGQQALQHGQRAVELAAQINNPEVQWLAAYLLGSIQRQLGLRAEALQSFRDSLTIIERLRADVVPADEARAGFLESKQMVYADTISSLLELGRGGEALEVAERARARAFLDLLGARELQAKSSDARALAHIRGLQEQLYPQKPLESSYSGMSREIAMRGNDLVSVELSELQQAQPELASMITVQPLALSQLKEEARSRRATLVEYLTTEDQLFIWVLEPGGMIHATSSKITRSDLNLLIEKMRRAIQPEPPAKDSEAEEQGGGAGERRSGGMEGGSPTVREGTEEAVNKPNGREYRPVLRRLYRALIEPIEIWLPKDPNQLVTIIPHGSLFLISFAALLDGRGRYFIERHTLNYVPAISVLRYTATKQQRVVHRQAPQLLVVGNPTMPRLPGRERRLPPLPGAETETLAIAALYPHERVTSLIGSRAQEGLVRELAPGQTIIHLATHGIIRDDEPLDSMVALAPEIGGQKSAVRSEPSGASRQGSVSGNGQPVTESDGLLTMREVFQLDLHADLVVLSACNTGLGKINGEGVIGLSRAFIYAGTPSVMVSLWRLADSVAKDQMEQFHRRLKQSGGDKAAALREAQMNVLRRLRQGRLRTRSGAPLREHPLLWAPFILVGEARS